MLIRGAWGSQPGQFGKRRDAESNPEAPMAQSAGKDGEVAILDQVNRRVERFRDGKRVLTIALGSDTAQDLALGAEGRTVVLDRLVDKNVQVYAADGHLLNEVSLDEKSAAGVHSESLTGVFSDRDGIYVEREHTSVLRIADVNGNRDRPPEELPGRPTRDGQLFIAATLVDARRGLVNVRAVRRPSLAPAWSQNVELGAPALHLLLLDSDARGNVYLAAETGHESPDPPYAIFDESLRALKLTASGTVAGSLTLPPLAGAEESFRPVSVDDGGALLVMSGDASGLYVSRYLFP